MTEVVGRHAPRCLGALVVAALLSITPAAFAVTVCSIGIGGSGKQFDTGTGGTGIDTGNGGTGVGTGGTGVQADIGTGGTGIDTGQAGTGQRADVGIGGTGIDTGNGGTGIDTGTGGTGIVGVITGFGSICVNGIEVEFDARTPVNDNGAPGSPNDLKIGQVVEVLAAGNGERVMARQIHVRDAVLGPVTSVDPRTSRVEVMHQPVRWDARTVPGQQGATALTIGDVRPGQYLRVSGFRTETGEVIASRIDPAPAGNVRVSGRLTDIAGSQGRVRGVAVELPAGQRIDAQSEVSVTGQWQGGSIRAMRIERDEPANFTGRAAFASIQGSVGRVSADGSLTVGSTRVKLGGSTRIEGGTRSTLRAGEIIQVEGRLSSGNVIDAEHVRLGDRLPRPDEHERNHGNRSSGGDSSPNGAGDDDSSKHGSDSSGRHDDDDPDSGREDGHGGRGDGSGDSSARSEKTEKTERDRVEKLERAERDRVEKIEKVERDRLERIEKLERDAAKEREKLERDQKD